MINPLNPVSPRPMTEKEAYARLGWRIEGGLGESGLNKLILPCSEPESDRSHPRLGPRCRSPKTPQRRVQGLSQNS